jgi:SAM-dependent methyltransferase
MPESHMTWEEAVQWLRDQPDQQELVRHCYYDDPLRTAAERFNVSSEWLAIQQLIAEHLPGEVLDLCAGRGISSYAFAKRGCSVTALEPDPSPLVGAAAIQDLATTTQLPIRVLREYGETLPFPDNAFDVVYGRAVLHHAADLPRLCSEASRVLKSGGVFLATREHVISKKADLQAFFESHPLHALYGGENAYLLDEYVAAIKASGLFRIKVVGPLENVINYAPLTRENLDAMVRAKLVNAMGARLAGWFGTSRTVVTFCTRYLTRNSDAPGRLYSFLARKK